MRKHYALGFFSYIRTKITKKDYEQEDHDYRRHAFLLNENLVTLICTEIVCM